MNRLLRILSLFVLLTACETESNDPLDGNSLYGTWQLSDVLFDPGDGSGIFMPRDSGEELTLHPNGTLVSNWDPCRLNGPVGEENKGKYLETGTRRFELLCATQENLFAEGVLEDGFLLLYYPCTEPCVYRFYKTADLRE